MLFNSLGFIFAFLPLAVLVYFALNHARLTLAAKAWLVLASLFFYGYWNPTYLLLILGSIIVNFALSEALRRQHYSSIALWAGISFNLGLLGYFKYADFFIANINWVSGAEIAPLNLVLPLAISFFTFQQIAYLVDCYKGFVKERDFLNYCLFVTYFPQLIAGPIVHHSEMMPQFANTRLKRLRWKSLLLGLFVFSIGLFKKVVIADTLSVWANAGFDSTDALGFYSAWGASLSYTFQLYYDFSGYTDMAIGAALMMNIRLPANFNSPYKASNIQDFWNRWHMTLSRWLRDYLYIPLGGNRCTEWRVSGNLLITFLLGGLWHGAGWTFVIWGALHGTAVIIHRYWKKTGFRMPVFIGWAITFLYVHIAWVFFRATSIDSALRILHGMADTSSMLSELPEGITQPFNSGLYWPTAKQAADYIDSLMPNASFEMPGLLLLAAALIAFICPNASQLAQRFFAPGKKTSPLIAVFIGIALATPLFLMVFMPSRISDFIYFNF